MTYRVAMLNLLCLIASPSNINSFTSISHSNFLSQWTVSSSLKMASIDDDLARWAKDAGHGDIVSSKSCGSSGWASFRRVTCSQGPCDEFFVKSSNRSAKEMFEGEALGLEAMYECSNNDDGLCIPKVFHYSDIADGHGSFLVMEYLTLSGRGDGHALGRAMARMHLAEPTAKTGNPHSKFGFALDNTIGGTAQPNGWTNDGNTQDWIEFYRDKRIGHQLHLAGDSYCSKLWDKDIAPRLDALFQGMEIRPSLLHGDLWSGNIASVQGKPSIYDPATYWGHHEAEWGMDWCASFGKSFWDGYRSLIPKDDGFDDRKPLYDAYHQLNHYNLFGGSYLGSARGCLESVKRSLDSM
eukprot:CAMPEP_0197826358 /NCGR_PEP_ID=MMETSP1437-20131217/3328_1 /TAXON_ID=49252 ORGANISM="Eucampia antarctica, Strain CCMP1452" /NCGR_SAMPLE_ID=MMETSP1437 /ASSEMBLY_ACC=CAM_ASM_001096 /LENGTH=352 /DNA_ID=CAMNT_0043426765 /DNA_START=53 /DNA_END=1111 /DNA_ORIENTATION=-